MKTRIVFAALVLVVSLVSAQTFISAKAGLVNYQEGVKFSSPQQLQEGEVFAAFSRTEILMMPGTYLRMDAGSQIQMTSTLLTSPAVDIKAGLMSIEAADLPKDSSMTIS